MDSNSNNVVFDSKPTILPATTTTPHQPGAFNTADPSSFPEICTHHLATRNTTAEQDAVNPHRSLQTPGPSQRSGSCAALQQARTTDPTTEPPIRGTESRRVQKKLLSLST